MDTFHNPWWVNVLQNLKQSPTVVKYTKIKSRITEPKGLTWNINIVTADVPL